MVRIDLWQRFDPLARPDRFKDNPWFNDVGTPFPEPAVMDTPTYSHVRLWSLGMRDLLNDPLGIKCFMQFLEKDFSSENLKFYLECLELDAISDATEYFDRCATISEKFAATGSPFELNLLASTRESILQQIADNAETPQKLKINVLQDAIDHILHLMQSASYSRFLQTPEIQRVLKQE